MISNFSDYMENRGVKINLFRCEDGDRFFSDKPKQAEYDREAENSDYFIAMFWYGAGEFTVEEIKKAYEHYKRTLTPKILAFILKPEETYTPETETEIEFFNRLKQFRQWCEEKKQYYMIGNHIAQLELEIEKTIRKDTDFAIEHSGKQHLMGHIAWPNKHFMGRDKEIDTIAELLSENGILFLYGIGGIGKSELAKSYAAKYRDRYDTVIYISYESNLFDLIIGDGIIIENFPPWNANIESAEAYFIRKMNAVRHLSNERAMSLSYAPKSSSGNVNEWKKE